MTRRVDNRLWPYGFGIAGVLVVAIVFVIYLNPFLLIDGTIRCVLRLNGVKRHAVMVNGHRIDYLEATPEGNGPDRPLVLIHGLGARALDWAPLIPQLAKHGYHVYALDLLGYGGSAKPTDSDYALTTEEGVVSGFMTAVQVQRADVAGWSMGGWIAMLLALDHPDRVRRLVLLDSAGLFFDPDFDYSLFVPSDRTGLARLVRRLEPDTPNFTVPGWAADGMLRRLHANGWIIQRSFRSMISGHSVLNFRLQQLHQPVMLVWGTEDKLTTYNQAEQLHELMPQSVLYGLSGCGHLAAAECSGAVLPLMTRFLAAEPPERAHVAIVSGKPERR